MTLQHQPQRRKARRFNDVQRCKSALGVAARKRNRFASAANENNWKRVGMFICSLDAHSDGRHFGLRVIGQQETRIDGTWRTCTGVVTRLFKEAIERQCNRDTTR